MKTKLCVGDIYMSGNTVKKRKEIITEHIRMVLLLERGRGLERDFCGCFWRAGNVLFLDLDGGYISVSFIIIL